MFNIIRIKSKVAGITTMTHKLSSQDPTEKSCVSYSHVSVSSSKDVVEQCGIFIEFLVMHWHFDLVLNASMLSNYESLHVSQLSVLCTCDESILPPAWSIWLHYFGWRASTFSSSDVPHWWRVWSFGAIVSFYDLLDLGFLFFCCQLGMTIGLWTWVHLHPCYTLWAWACLWRRTWRWRTRRFWEQIHSILRVKMVWTTHAELGREDNLFYLQL